MARPKLQNESERKLKLTITLTQKDINYIKKKGKGNSSQGIRQILHDIRIGVYK